MVKASSAQPPYPELLMRRPTLHMPPSPITPSPEIQEIVQRSNTEQELLTNLLSFAVDLISEDDFADLPPRTSKFSKHNNDSLHPPNTEGRQ
ncbi:MAG: hypothetical protein SGBAC_011006 [Bacillariaceae sp.]